MKSIDLLKSVIQLIENNKEVPNDEYGSFMCATRSMIYNEEYTPDEEFKFLDSHDLCEKLLCHECIFYLTNKQEAIDTINKLIPILQLEELIK